MGMKKSSKIIFTILGVIVAVYTLFPFYLVVLNTFKNANGIVANPVGFGGVSFSQLMSNISAVVNNSNFNFWYAFGTSVIITVLSLVLLALFGGMAAWVICRNKTMVYGDLYGIYRVHDHTFPGCYAASDLYLPGCEPVYRDLHAAVHSWYCVCILRVRRSYDRIYPDRVHQGDSL